ncbi:hypothetical protein VAR608DRAFT_4898 [Variovorax sp. HW608]|uniref:hypothetical protein n=1 Tax=Variovorax sp. HW608 TaxID=1034889 RepID=UPI00081FF371|nr:hypothetical protein [Variovorax sp. HW608]SCK49227.1 hypothetical protein VAR608DRAFT_4898 [Variovorax sp. HW608]
MRFTLTYRGPLPANGNPRDKQVIRRQLHPQLKHLFTYPPLKSRVDTMLADPAVESAHRPSIVEKVGLFRFAPVVTTKYHLVATLELLFLRPEPPGSLISRGGDIDNRLKTLFDALRMPRVESEIPKGDSPATDEDPFFCLLQEDTLITELDVKTDVLLDPSADPSQAHLFIRVRTETVVGTFANLDL